MEFLGSALQHFKPRLDDDFVDRLNYYYTCSCLIFLGLAVSARQWVGQPIECWAPAYFTNPWEEYTENYCFVQNTYFKQLDDRFSIDDAKRYHNHIGYYQWVPFILIFQASLFYLPYLIYRFLIGLLSGINVHSVVKIAKENSSLQDSEEQEKEIRILGSFIYEIIKLQRRLQKFSVHSCMPTIPYWLSVTRGCHLTLVYLFTKLLYMANALGQLFFLNNILATGNHHYGFDLFFYLFQRNNWLETGNFPRVTMCDFNVRSLGNVENHTVQCVLMINMFNEVIFALTWLWISIVFSITAVNFLYWVYSIANARSRIDFVGHYLNATAHRRSLTGADDEELAQHRRLLRHFVLRTAGHDGVLVLKKLSSHAGVSLTTKVVDAMFTQFCNKKSAPGTNDNHHSCNRKPKSANENNKADGNDDDDAKLRDNEMTEAANDDKTDLLPKPASEFCRRIGENCSSTDSLLPEKHSQPKPSAATEQLAAIITRSSPISSARSQTSTSTINDDKLSAQTVADNSNNRIIKCNGEYANEKLNLKMLNGSCVQHNLPTKLRFQKISQSTVV